MKMNKIGKCFSLVRYAPTHKNNQKITAHVYETLDILPVYGMMQDPDHR